MLSSSCMVFYPVIVMLSSINGYDYVSFLLQQTLPDWNKCVDWLQHNELGVGIVGICEADFLEPTHDKQNFNRTDKFK